jgi:hypothetical protein
LPEITRFEIIAWKSNLARLILSFPKSRDFPNYVSGFGVSVGPAIIKDGEALFDFGVVAEPTALTSSIGGGSMFGDKHINVSDSRKPTRSIARTSLEERIGNTQS